MINVFKTPEILLVSCSEGFNLKSSNKLAVLCQFSNTTCRYMRQLIYTHGLPGWDRFCLTVAVCAAILLLTTTLVTLPTTQFMMQLKAHEQLHENDSMLCSIRGVRFISFFILILSSPSIS